MGKKLTDAQAGFSGGLNTTGDPSMLRPDQARQLTNYRLSPFGAATKRGGTQRSSATIPNTAGTNQPISAGIWWPVKRKHYIVAGISPLLYSGGPSVPITWTVVASATGILSYPDLAIFVNASAAETLYLADGDAAGLKSYDGTTWSGGIASTPTVNGLQVYNSRLWGWFTGSSATAPTLYYGPLSSALSSAGGDGLGVAASGGGSIVVQTFGQRAIVSCAVIGSSLMIFHTQGISRLTGFGQDDISVSPQAVDTEFSLICRDAVVVYKGIGYGVSPLGLFRITEGGAEPVQTPDKPDPLPAALAAISTTSLTQVAYNSNTNEVWIFIAGTGVYVYNTILESWSGPFTGAYAVSQGVFVPYPGEPYYSLPPYMAFGDLTGWHLKCDISTYKDNVASDGTGGSAYTGTLQPHRFFCNERAYSKAWRWVQIMATLGDTSTTPVVKCNSVHGGTNTTTVAVTATTQDVYYVGPTGVGPWLDVIITDAGVSATQFASIGVESYFLGQR